MSYLSVYLEKNQVENNYSNSTYAYKSDMYENSFNCILHMVFNNVAQNVIIVSV